MSARLMAAIRVDTAGWPITVVTLPSVASDDEVQAYLDALAALRNRRQNYALIVDANLSRGFSAKQRQMQADYIDSGMDLSRRYLRAFAFVAGTPMQRGMLTAIFWLRRPAWPHDVFPTLAEAKTWCESHLDGAD